MLVLINPLSGGSEQLRSTSILLCDIKGNKALSRTTTVLIDISRAGKIRLTNSPANRPPHAVLDRVVYPNVDQH